MNTPLFTQKYWHCLNNETLLVHFFSSSCRQKNGFNYFWQSDRCKGHQKRNITLYMHCMVYHVPYMIKRLGSINHSVVKVCALACGYDKGWGVTLIGTMSRAATAVKIFDHQKMDLTAGRLIAPGAKAQSHLLVASSANFGTEYSLIDPQTVPFNPLTAYWLWSQLWTWSLWEWPPLLWLWGLFFHSYQ